MTASAARFFDGQSARPRAATVSPRSDGLDILLEAETEGGPPERQTWPAADIRFVDAADRGESRTFTNIAIPMSRLVMTSHDDAVRLGRRLGVAHEQAVRVSLRARTILLLTPAAVAIGALLWFGIPWLSAALAPHLPYSWRHGLGRYVVKAVTAGDKFCTAPAGRAALDTLVARLVTAAGHTEPVRVEVTDSKSINALATPGGSIVVFNGLIKDAESAEELAGVLGHELGHVIKEHPTDGVLRGFGVGFAMTVVFGGSDGGLASAAATVHALSYGRRAEREADAIAADLLEKLNVDPKALASFFARLEKKEGSDEDFGVLNYLSTHPATSERVAAAQLRKAPLAPEKLLTDEAWQELKAICKKPEDS